MTYAQGTNLIPVIADLSGFGLIALRAAEPSERAQISGLPSKRAGAGAGRLS